MTLIEYAGPKLLGMLMVATASARCRIETGSVFVFSVLVAIDL